MDRRAWRATVQAKESDGPEHNDPWRSPTTDYRFIKPSCMEHEAHDPSTPGFPTGLPLMVTNQWWELRRVNVLMCAEGSLMTIYSAHIPMMATLFSFMELSTCSSFSSDAIFCTSLRWCSWNSTGTEAAFKNRCQTSQDQNRVSPFQLKPSSQSRPRPLTLNTSLTACISSGPTPSPGSIVTGKAPSTLTSSPCGQGQQS